MQDSRDKNGLTRRRALKGAMLGTVAAPFVAKFALGQSSFDWKRFNGEKIEVLLAKGPRADLLQKHQKEFEDLTGITVGAEQVPEQQQRQKQVIEFTSGATTFDVTQTAWHVQKKLFGKTKWLSDLRPMLADATLTAPDFDYADFSTAGVRFATQADGRVDSFPNNIDYHLVFWNQDLFEKKGIKFPDDYDGMLEAAKALHDPANGIYGYVGRGLKNANVPVWTNLLLGWDIDSIDPKTGQINCNTDEAIAAAQMYKDISAKYGPAGLSGFNWMESQAAFMQGRVAMWMDGIGFSLPLEDKTKSRIAGRVGYGPMPKGPKVRHSGMFGDGMGVSAYTKKQGPAYYYIQWAANKTNHGRILQTGSGVPARNSAFSNPEVLANLTAPKAFLDAAIYHGKIGRESLPVVIPVTEFRDI